MLAPERREFALTFWTERGQTFVINDAPSAAAEPVEEELGPVLLAEPEDNFVVSIVDLALMAA